jgi:hypothetical protein
MVAYLRRSEPAERSSALSRDLFHNATPQQLDREARELAQAEATPPQVRARLEAKLIERLKTPVDRPSWGPDWVRDGDRHAPKRRKVNRFAVLLAAFGVRPKEHATSEPPPLTPVEQDDTAIIARNLEKSRQVWGYRSLYAAGAVVALIIALLAMSVDYQIIHGDVWTRALSNEFMQVPASLQTSVVFKSLQVIFAVLIVHFMLKITGIYGRNTLITAAFVLALVMIGSLGYLVAYNNMAGATSASVENREAADAAQPNAIDKLFDSTNGTPAPRNGRLIEAGMTAAPAVRDEVSLDVPGISQTSLANADSWIWLAFASVIFFIVTTVAALYLQTVENNVRNFLIARDYNHRSRNFAQLHLLSLADRRQGIANTAGG